MAGMELLFATAQSQIQNNADAVVCAVHWNLIANKFKCIGVGEQAPASTAGVKRSEMLPAGWRDDQDVYTLLYLPEGSNDAHVLKVVRMDDALMVHLMRNSDNKVSDMTVNIADFTTEDLTSFDSAYKNLEGLSKIFSDEIIKPLSTSTSSSSRDQRQQEGRPAREDRRRAPDDPDPLRIGPPRRGGRPVPEWGDPENPFAVGRGDLDPLAGGMGGGMFMDPRGFPGMGGGRHPSAGLPGRLPPGAVPPGARFDPFGPPDLDPSGGHPRGGPRSGPDPDHLPPPGSDDMFM